MDRIVSGTPDLTQENIKKLAELFPDVVTEGEVWCTLGCG